VAEVIRHREDWNREAKGTLKKYFHGEIEGENRRSGSNGRGRQASC
jgi:hypothetical protein